MNINTKIPRSLSAQLVHWSLAIERLEQLDDIASPEGWAKLERQTNTILRSTISQSIRTLKQKANMIMASTAHSHSEELTRAIQNLRRDYLQTETMLDFFADAINTRSSETTGSLLAALDSIAAESMRQILVPLGYSTPPVITYIDKGLGASVLKAGLRLWDRRSINPAAAIKVVRHNILTSTATLHETGHQVAHIVGWNDEFSEVLRAAMPKDISETWASWASEIAADAFAFVNAGYASVTALRNVVDGGPSHVFRFIEGDPHPVGFVRVLLGAEMSRRAFGAHGPWQELVSTWQQKYPISLASGRVAELISESLPALGRVVQLALYQRYRAFGEKSLAQIINPIRVSPQVLEQFERTAGPRAYSLPYVVHRESIRLLALSGLRMAMNPERGREYYEKQKIALQVLGQEAIAA